ncbi:hypothetical protein [Salinarimonas soli]|uniref:Uncharacterized protein n=1 Tax=Salinarimonas soli TaxID=1638099 RepID=A0A5B2V5E1_9HYPH|nr:hypothetical protein [Salinarimonas soli]KAA2234116.1 hypothetical protein F0L46_24400 [Salinarimonas soli]
MTAASHPHPDLDAELCKAGFSLVTDSAKLLGYRRRIGEIIYVKKTQKKSVVVDPRYFSHGEVISGVEGYSYWNSNLSEFQKSPRGGLKPERNGIAFDIPTAGHVINIAHALRGKL